MASIAKHGQKNFYSLKKSENFKKNSFYFYFYFFWVLIVREKVGAYVLFLQCYEI